MKKRRTKLFLKAFNVTNAEGKLTKEDFELFKEKFDIIKDLYYDPNVEHEYFDSFRTITKEVKRAAHNAGLRADIIDLDYKSTPRNTTLVNPHDTDVEFNMFIAIKSAAKFTREFDFVVTTMQAFDENIRLAGTVILDEPVSYKITLSDDMYDEQEISYYFMEE